MEGHPNAAVLRAVSALSPGQEAIIAYSRQLT